MMVELRSVPDCPHLPATRALLRECLAELGLPLSFSEAVGEYPSPTVLVDGVDLTGNAACESGAACRLDLPTGDDIRTALRSALAAAIRADRPVRAAQLPRELRAAHRGMLRHFAATGRAPTAMDLTVVFRAAGADPATALGELAAVDLVAVDDDGELLAAYPFSPVPTQHVVRWDGSAVHAMCAIDASPRSPVSARSARLRS